MKTKIINLYEFDELSESAKEKAISNLYDLNVDHNWWEFVYEDAERIGLKIAEFDLDQKYCRGSLIKDFEEVIALIKKEHGEAGSAYKTALKFEEEKNKLVAKYSDGKNINQVDPKNNDQFDCDMDELEEDFLKSLLENYRIFLHKEYEYLTSREAIIESIKANEYTFTQDGKLENV